MHSVAGIAWSPVTSRRRLTGPARKVLSLLREWQSASAEPESLVVETSGSTGEPKRVLLPRAAMRASAIATHRRLGGPGQWLLALPPSYVAGAQVLFRSVLADAEPVLLDEHENLSAAVAAMTGPRRYVSLVPTQLVRMLASEPDGTALRGFDAVLVGGAALDAGLREAAERAGVRVVSTYGMSESCGGCVYDGVALDGVAVAISAEGRIRLAGPVLFDGYDERPDLTADVLDDGWFLTSDRGRLGGDGKLQVLGRTDDVVLSGGVSVPTPAVAARIREHPDVLAAEVVGVRDEEWGHQVVAVVVAKGAVGLGDVRDFVSAEHPRAWAPRRLVVADQIPLLGNGKTDRAAVERMAAVQNEARLDTERGTARHRTGRGSTPNGARLDTERGAGQQERGRPMRVPAERHVPAEQHVYSIPMAIRFRGIDVREGMLFEGPAGWGEFSPFAEYDAEVAEPWLRCALEAAVEGWPAPVRTRVPVNVTVPAVAPDVAHRIVIAGRGCRTAKVKVAERGQALGEDQARLEAVRDALGADGRIRVDANGGWPVADAVAAIGALDRASGGLEYVEQPCASAEELAAVRRKVDVPIAADESIRRAEDPYRVRDLHAADIAVPKVQPLGGVRACLRIAEDMGLPVVVPSALESSVGIAAGVALAAALPELPHACGLATVSLLTGDVVHQPLLPVDGELPVVRPEVDPSALSRLGPDADRVAAWTRRLAEIEALGQDRAP